MTARAFERVVRAALAGAGVRRACLLAAVSGGPDSMALLYSLIALRHELELELVGAHLDHGLRDEESAADAEFVRSVFESLGMRSFVEAADREALARAGMSPEEAAREARYAFLARSAAACGAWAVALGHTADDQAETVLMNIIRGSGLSGLRGMRTLTGTRWGGTALRLLRPLLRLGRAETAAYCEALNLKPRLDRTNLSPTYTRNRVRMELIPALESFNPAVRESLLRLSDSASVDLAYLEAQTDLAWGRAAVEKDGSVRLRREAFSDIPEAVGRRILRRAVDRVKGDLEDVELNHVEDMARLMAGGAGARLDLPGGVSFEVGYELATVALAGKASGVAGIEGFDLRVPGRAASGAWTVETGRVAREEARLAACAGGLTASLDLEAAGWPLTVRGRAPGDRFQPLGMTGSKSLKEISVASRDLSTRARNGVLRPEEYTEATVAISNLGMFQVDSFIAIINPLQSASIAVGSVTKQPVVRDGQITIADIMQCTISADHRVVNGAEAAQFVNEIKSNLEKPSSLLL